MSRVMARKTNGTQMVLKFLLVASFASVAAFCVLAARNKTNEISPAAAGRYAISQVSSNARGPEEIEPRFIRGMSGDSIEERVVLGFTVYKASDGISLTVFYNDFKDASEASAIFEKKLIRAAKVLMRGQKIDRGGKIVGERAEIRLPQPNETLSAVMWTDGRKFHEIVSISLQDTRALEKVYRY
jgi:hypothetical protein